MNIPLDNLYHWIRGRANDSLSIYTFVPHGSKNIANLEFLDGELDPSIIAPELICHDQEPLNFDQYKDSTLTDLAKKINQRNFHVEFGQELADLEPHYQNLNFLLALRLLKSRSIFDRYILLHSEKNSKDVEQFSVNAEPVYYWCHGILARDWYRFAQHDTRLNELSQKKNTFLVYCRAWSGTREYRLKFLDLLIDQNLISHCHTSIIHVDQDQELSSYQCKNIKLQPTNLDELLKLPNNTEQSTASADYCVEDILETDISVVLETVADDSKIHLTEKTLRPIACGHPFMLVAGPGSLDYLKSYGFKTFAPWINESYDSEPDVVKRMQMVATEMSRIQNLSNAQKTQLLAEIRKISMFNKKHFFSNDFFNTVQSELTENLNQAINNVKNTQGKRYIDVRLILKKYTRQHSNPRLNYQRNLEVAKVLRMLRHDPTISIKKISENFPKGFFKS